MRNIIHDYDGCLINYIGGFGTFLGEFHGIEVDPAGPSDYDLTKWIGLDHQRVLEFIMQFNSNEGGFFENLQPNPGAVEAVALFREMGFTQEVVTACHDAEQTQTSRLANSDGHFGKFDTFEFVSLTGSKEPNFSRREPSFLIEDNLKNALLGAKLGHHVFLVDTVYNQTGPDTELPVTRVFGWDQICDQISTHAHSYAPTV